MVNAISYLKSLAQPNDTWQYEGMTLFVLHKTYKSAHLPDMPSMIRDGHWNGYVLTSIHVPESDAYELDVWGGVTLCEHNATVSLYGFDTAHADDQDNSKSREWVMEETRKLADEILAWHKKNTEG